MSQNIVDFSGNPTGAGLMDDYLDKELENILTSNSGVQRPSYAVAGTKWIDTSATPWLLKMYDGTDDVVIGTIDPSTHKFIASIPLTTTGDLIIQNEDGKPERLASGTAGTVLTSNGIGQVPSWQKSPIDIKQDLKNPSANTIPSTKAVADESSRIMSVMNNKIGEITSFVCSSTYIPRGCLPCDGGEYSKEQFKDLWNNYLVDRKLLTCTYTEYANDISTYGQCAKFAIDTTNNKFKVPTIKDGSYITQAKSDNELGKSYNESLPNIIGEFSPMGLASVANSNGCFSTISNADTDYAVQVRTGVGARIRFNASKASSTYQVNAKVQGDNVRLRFFVVVANGEINQSVMDWSAWATSLNGKMDKDASNITSAAKSIISGWSMPSGRFIDLSLGASGSSYTAPANGYFFVEKNTQAAGQFLIFNTANMEQESIAVYADNWVGGFVPVKKGMNCQINYTASGAVLFFRFIYAEGEN